MAHFVIIEDRKGELADLEVYCSDFCAQYSQYYNGWYGAQEVEFDTPCHQCGQTVIGATISEDQE